ncbi:hypothetical protein jhhlp_005861 [Lomentospora prolificans]|uniref:Phospholipid-transporting ATPase n=1 Tax=Lomentospora prolificans TaxID=41688 RepID=A0A2N3N4A5_9PEZI|nr:hypothetical protein jhhlp_005861 [Lomentospora prolificans]
MASRRSGDHPRDSSQPRIPHDDPARSRSTRSLDHPSGPYYTPAVDPTPVPRYQLDPSSSVATSSSARLNRSTSATNIRSDYDRQHVRFSHHDASRAHQESSTVKNPEKLSMNEDSSTFPVATTPSAATVSDYTFTTKLGLFTSSRINETCCKVKHRSALLYRRYIVEGLLRQKPLPPSADGRHILLNPAAHCPQDLLDERSGKPYVSNFIRSSRYTVWDFLPKQLIFQFSRLANFYFLVMGIMQMIPGLSTTGKYTTIVPLAIFVSFSMAKEGFDDYRRYALDKAENRSSTWVLRGSKDDAGTRRPKKLVDRVKGEKSGNSKDEEDATEVQQDGDWMRVEWQDIVVGDIVRLHRDDNVPADLVLLHATGPNCTAYIETMALDGETNLKSKQGCPLLAGHCATVEALRNCQAEVVSEDPNLDLYNYDGRITVNGETLPLTSNNIIYRGSTMRNTTEAIGLVVNSGEECKIRMNAHKNIRAKAPAIQSLVNKIVLFLVFFVVMLSIGLTIGYYRWRAGFEKLLWYLMGASLSFKNIFIAFLLMFNTLIPLSLYISLEIIKLGQLYFLGDVEMYDPVTNTPMVANTMTILENLGQVNYVFSDKTGTLTENVMRFRKMSVAGTAWLHDMDVKRDEAEKQRKIEESERLRKKKKKSKQPATNSAPEGKIVDDDDDDDDAVTGVGGPAGPRESMALSDLGSPHSPVPGRYAYSHFGGAVAPSSTSMARVAAGPEPKTEDLLRYIRERPNTSFSRKARHFIISMALCNTCLPEIAEDGGISYQAASPDELALVEAARDLGYEMVDRPADSIKLKYTDLATGNVSVEQFEVLDVIEFTSKRKRMSIIIRMPDGRICVFCKGADSALLPRLKLSGLAIQKARDVEIQANRRRSEEQENVIRRRSLHGTPRNSMALSRSSMTGARPAPSWLASTTRASLDFRRKSQDVGRDSHDIRGPRRSMGDMVASPITASKPEGHFTPRPSLTLSAYEMLESLVDESVAVNEGTVFERCFQHTDDFATDGLRTLLFAYRYVEEDDYRTWKKIYHEATTSLVDRQQRIEAAGELIEQKFDLAGATAIEDKLQDGVPETIDKLRRANIKVWMLTGDKRETAINIGHSARVCKPFSEIYILDANLSNLLDTLTSTLTEIGRGMVPHSVVVVDGQTLSDIDDDKTLSTLFYDLVIRVDSVICCRASPSQKAQLIKKIRHRIPESMTLAIGDGANDIGMILASHVGIGISGREGLQAARIADYSIAQFRFLQRLLFVHGRWNYIRTSKYILATFWKEIFFFLAQAHYQLFTGYTGTSLFENWSLTVFNGVFTSIPVIILGIIDQDLSAKTLLAFPELYNFGQRCKGFNYKNFIVWAVLGALESCLLFYMVWAVYRKMLFTSDTSLFAMGNASFTVGVIFINVKLLVLEMHTKNIITFAGLFLSITGWFMWNLLLGAIYPDGLQIYQVPNAFMHNFGHTLTWWAIVLLVLLSLIVVELVVSAVRRVYWPGDWDIMQRVEKDGKVEEMRREIDAEMGDPDSIEVLGSNSPVEGGMEMREMRESRPAGDSLAVPGASGSEVRSSFQEMRSSFQDRRPSFQDKRPSFQDKRPSFQDKRPSFQDKRPSFQDKRNSFQERRADSSTHRRPRQSHDEYARPSFTPLGRQGTLPEDGGES